MNSLSFSLKELSYWFVLGNMQQIHHHVELVKALLVNQKEMKSLRNVGQGSNVLLSWVQVFIRCCVLNTYETNRGATATFIRAEHWGAGCEWANTWKHTAFLGHQETWNTGVLLSRAIPATFLGCLGKWGHFPSLRDLSERFSPAHQEQRVGSHPSSHCSSATSLLACRPQLDWVEANIVPWDFPEDQLRYCITVAAPWGQQESLWDLPTLSITVIRIYMVI